MRKKYTIDDMQRFARKRGGKCLSKEYAGAKTNLVWQCREGHTWSARARSIASGTWCPVCAGVRKLSIEHMQKIAKERGGRCLSKTYKGSATKLLWQCKEGHKWMARPGNVSRGDWCPECGREYQIRSDTGRFIAYISKRLAKTIGDSVRSVFEKL